MEHAVSNNDTSGTDVSIKKRNSSLKNFYWIDFLFTVPKEATISIKTAVKTASTHGSLYQEDEKEENK